MNKLALTILLFSALLVGFSASAQRKKDSGYDKGTFLINGGIGIGRTYYSGIGDIALPSINGNAEWSVHEWVGVGPYVGILAFEDGAEFAVGARGTFHYGQFIPGLDTDMLDLYGTAHLGVNIRHIKDGEYRNGQLHDYNHSYPIFGPVAGARWFPTKGGFGVFGEVGYGPLGILTLGISGKF
jgi:hypothetical protein